MKRWILGILSAAMLWTAGGCSVHIQITPDGQAGTQPAASDGAGMETALAPGGSSAGQTDEVTAQTALEIALDHADVPQEDAYNIKTERDGDNGIPVYDLEFETDYGDYDFEVAIADGRIVGADYEVDEEWLDRLGGSPVSVDEAKELIVRKVPGAAAEEIRIREEQEDGRGRYEGELFFQDMKYEFEIDPATGRIYDWNADLRR